MIGASLSGLKIIVSDNAVKDGARVRTYPKRKAKSPAHWRRMDKKWRKRYGFKKEPCAYQFGNHMIVHPSIYAALRTQVNRSVAHK